jgi:hypothetical protein
MRRLADRLVNLLLRIAPWYRPEEIEKRERRTQDSHRHSINARIRAEAMLAEQRFRQR